MGGELKIIFERKQGGLVVRLAGRIDFHTAPDLESRVKFEAGEGLQFLLINLSQVSYLPSLAIATLLNLYRFSAESNMKMALCEVPPPIKRMLDLAEVGHTFPEFAAESAGLAALATDAG